MGARYVDGVCKWFEGDQSSIVTQFFWHSGHSEDNPQCVYVYAEGWNVHGTCDQLNRYICEW